MGKELSANMKNAGKQLQEKELTVSGLKDKINRMQTELQEQSVDLESATKREREAKDEKTEEETKQAQLRKQVAAVKDRADAVSAKINHRKAEVEKLREDGSKAQ